MPRKGEYLYPTRTPTVKDAFNNQAAGLIEHYNEQWKTESLQLRQYFARLG